MFGFPASYVFNGWLVQYKVCGIEVQCCCANTVVQRLGLLHFQVKFFTLLVTVVSCLWQFCLDSCTLAFFMSQGVETCLLALLNIQNAVMCCMLSELAYRWMNDLFLQELIITVSIQMDKKLYKYILQIKWRKIKISEEEVKKIKMCLLLH